MDAAAASAAQTRRIFPLWPGTAGHAACDKTGQVAGLITAGRRECWGSQTSGAGGHRNHAVPFCFVHWLRRCASTSTRTSANLRRHAIGDDAGLMASITSANVAAGFHAGDPSILAPTIRGRQRTTASPSARIRAFRISRASAGARWTCRRSEAEDLVLYQIAAVAGVAAAEGVSAPAREAARRALQHGGARPGPRGGDRARHRGVRSVADPLRAAWLGAAEGRPRGRTSRRGRSVRRSRLRAGRLARVRGSKPGAVIHDADAVVSRAIRMAKDRTVTAVDGSIVRIDARDDLRARRHAGRRRIWPPGFAPASRPPASAITAIGLP